MRMYVYKKIKYGLFYYICIIILLTLLWDWYTNFSIK